MSTINSAEGEVTRRYPFRVDRYWDRKQQLPNGSCIQSYSFKAGGYFWRISYYPNGARPSNTDHISIFITLRNRVAKPVRARATFSLLDRNGEPVSGQSAYTDVHEYSAPRAGYGFQEFIRKDYLEASEHLVNAGVTIRCDISVHRETPLCGLHDFSAPTDVTFRVHGAAFHAHRSVFASRSSAFAAELPRWDAAVAAGRCALIDGISVRAFNALQHFVYTDALPHMDERQESIIVEDLLAAADRFDLPELKPICAEILSREINENTVTKMLNLASRHRCQVLHEYCIEFLKDHPALDAIMASDDGSLLEHVTKSCPEIVKEVCADLFGDDSIQNDMVVC